MYFTRQQASWPANLWNTSISAYRRLVLLLYGSSMHFTIHFNFDRNRTHNVCRTKAISFTKMIKIQSHTSKLKDGWSWAENNENRTQDEIIWYKNLTNCKWWTTAQAVRHNQLLHANLQTESRQLALQNYYHYYLLLRHHRPTYHDCTVATTYNV